MKTSNKSLALALCILCSIDGAMAQEMTDRQTTPPQEKHLRAIPNPEKSATQMTNQLKKSLQLTDKQYKKIHKLILKEQKERFEAIQSSGQRPQRMDNGQGMRRGGRPQMDGMRMEGSEPPMMREGGFPDRMGMNDRAPGRENNAETQKKEAETKEKKFKKILTTEQFEKWKAEQKTSREKEPKERRNREIRPNVPQQENSL